MKLKGLFSSAIVAVLLGACGGSSNPCPSGQVQCAGQCVDVMSDRNNCGNCGVTCLSGQTCELGQCTACSNECQQGQRQCVTGSQDQFQVCGDPDGDTCLEWGPPQSCPAGQICNQGQCVESCTDECIRTGEQACDKDGANGYRVCGQFDTDDCLDWGPLQPCASNQTCAGGQCVAACTDECSDLNQTRCAPPPGNGIETCADHDGDTCLEWGNYVPCSTGMTCDTTTVQCSADCNDDCQAGQRTCDGDGYRTCGQYDADLCLDWSGITSCQSWEVCNPDTGECETACTDACRSGERQCNGNDVELCGNWDQDPCLEWQLFETCQAGTKCENGRCVEDCKDECDPQGARICQNDASGNPGFRVCGNYDGDSCLEWSTLTLCQSNETCSNGVCSENCQDECASGDKECFGSGWRTCGEAGDGDSCLDWLPEQPCQSWEVCDPNTVTCVSNCSDECSVSGQQQCTADFTGYRQCGNWDQDPCKEWSDVITCSAGHVCSPATNDCVCEFECPYEGATQCLDNTTVQTCSDYNQDGCREWGNDTQCPTGEVCSNGQCASSCNDECQQEGTVCDATENGWRPCGYFDTDSCLDLGSLTYCASNEQCQVDANGDAQCVQICTDECSPTDRPQCNASANAVTNCAVDGDSDPCYEWKEVLNCGTGEVCHQGVCVSDTPPAQLKISEVLYDSDGTPDLYAFIEIYGPGGLSLDHFSIRGYNGSATTDPYYMEIDLTGYTIPANGHFVIARTDTALDPSAVDLFDDNADLQNGTGSAGDGVQIVWAGTTVVDALAYEGDAGGEGTPADSADYDSTNGITWCLNRLYDNASGTYLDTDDNATDFLARTYCAPGGVGVGLRVYERNTLSKIDGTPALDPYSGAVTQTSEWFVDEIMPDFTSGVWYDYISGEKSSAAYSPDGSAVYFGVVGTDSADSGVYAYQSYTGGATSSTPLWHALSGTAVKSSPAVGADGTIYVGTRGGGFVALNPDGSTKWTWASTDWIDSSPLVTTGPGSQEIVVFGVGGIGSGRIVALYTSDGSEAWTVNVSGGGCNGSPAVGSLGYVYIGCDDGYLHAVRADTGAEETVNFPVLISSDGAGTAEFVDGRGVAVAPAAGGGDLIYATSSGSGQNLNIIYFDGSSAPSVNSYSFGDAISSVAILADGGIALVYGEPFNGQAYLLTYGPWGNIEFWDTLGSYDASAWIVSSPNALRFEDSSGNRFGLIYVGTYDGYVYAYLWVEGLYYGAGSFPKFRGNEANQGMGF